MEAQLKQSHEIDVDVDIDIAGQVRKRRNAAEPQRDCSVQRCRKT